jgi:hypothetical protein
MGDVHDLSAWADFGDQVSRSALPFARASDFDSSGTVDFGDLVFLATNFGRDASDPGPAIYAATFPDDWRSQSLRVDATLDPAPSPDPLTRDQLAPVVEQAVERLASVRRDDSSKLRDATVEIVDLPGDLLGRAIGDSTIQIDIDAAGYGWFVDATPWDDVEFARPQARHELIALPDSSAADRADLLTVILHELGHVLGHDHSDDGVMDAVLPLGTRRVWDDSLLGDLEKSDTLLDAPDLTATAVDNYFATT